MVTIKVTGYAGKDAEKYGKITTLSVNAGARINGTKNDAGKFEYNNEWYNFICFDRSLDNISKGDKITITGTMEYNTYINRSGKKVISQRYIVTSVKKENPSNN